MAQKVKRLLMLSNEVDLGKPVELFTQLSTIRHDLFPDFTKYAKHYCNAKQGVFGWDYSGKSNQAELKFILDKAIWIRRTKDQVRDELTF